MHDLIRSYQEEMNQPATLIAVGLCIFILHFLSVTSTLDAMGGYNLNGMWITIPDFAQRLNDPDSILERVYTRLNGWDGQWYYHIAQNGYQCPGIPASNNPHICNVAFFPLVPALGTLVSQLGIDLVYAIPLVSQLAWLATILLTLFFIRSITPLQPLQILILLVLVSYPGAVYGFVSYSESVLTLLALLVTSLTYWYLNNPRNRLLWLLALACFLACLTKVSGVIILAIPVLMALLHPAAERRWFSARQVRVYCASAAGLLGILVFLIYCEIRFGNWALYFHYVGAAWGGGQGGVVTLNPFSIFTSFVWHDYIPLRISNVIVVTLPAVILLFVVLLLRNRRPLDYLYIPVVFTVAMLFYFYSCLGNSEAFKNYNIARHMFPLVALMTIPAMLLLSRHYRRAGLVAIALGLLGVISIQIYAQDYMIEAFVFGNWVS